MVVRGGKSRAFVEHFFLSKIWDQELLNWVEKKPRAREKKKQ